MKNNVHEITLTNNATYEAIGELCNGNCEPVANDKGMLFSSIIDAAKYAGVIPSTMWYHLNSDAKKPRPIKGDIYFYVKKRDESFGRVMKCLSEKSAEVERRKADEEDARKWRAYQAEQEAKRLAEEKRIEDERKAKEKYERDVARAIAKVENRKEIHKRLQEKTSVAERRVIEAEMELEALLDMNQQVVA